VIHLCRFLSAWIFKQSFRLNDTTDGGNKPLRNLLTIYKSAKRDNPDDLHFIKVPQEQQKANNLHIHYGTKNALKTNEQR